MKLSEAANSFSRLSGDYGLLSLQDLLDRVPSKWNIALRTPWPKCDKVHMRTFPQRSERGLVMNQRETDTSKQVLKFAPKEEGAE